MIRKGPPPLTTWGRPNRRFQLEPGALRGLVDAVEEPRKRLVDARVADADERLEERAASQQREVSDLALDDLQRLGHALRLAGVTIGLVGGQNLAQCPGRVGLRRLVAPLQQGERDGEGLQVAHVSGRHGDGRHRLGIWLVLPEKGLEAPEGVEVLQGTEGERDPRSQRLVVAEERGEALRLGLLQALEQGVLPPGGVSWALRRASMARRMRNATRRRHRRPFARPARPGRR